MAKYDGEGLNGTFKNWYFAQRARGGNGPRSVIGLSPRDVTMFDCFPCNGITWHLKNSSSATSLQLNNILVREQYQFRGIFEDNMGALLQVN